MNVKNFILNEIPKILTSMGYGASLEIGTGKIKAVAENIGAFNKIAQGDFSDIDKVIKIFRNEGDLSLKDAFTDKIKESPSNSTVIGVGKDKTIGLGDIERLVQTIVRTKFGISGQNPEHAPDETEVVLDMPEIDLDTIPIENIPFSGDPMVDKPSGDEGVSVSLDIPSGGQVPPPNIRYDLRGGINSSVQRLTPQTLYGKEPFVSSIHAQILGYLGDGDIQSSNLTLLRSWTKDMATDIRQGGWQNEFDKWTTKRLESSGFIPSKTFTSDGETWTGHDIVHIYTNIVGDQGLSIQTGPYNDLKAIEGDFNSGNEASIKTDMRPAKDMFDGDTVWRLYKHGISANAIKEIGGFGMILYTILLRCMSDPTYVVPGPEVGGYLNDMHYTQTGTTHTGVPGEHFGGFTVRAKYCNQKVFAKLCEGELSFLDAGWIDDWADGKVIVVPYYTKNSSDGAVNAEWTLAHLPHPFNHHYARCTLRSEIADFTISSMVAVWPQAQRVIAIPAAFRFLELEERVLKVLYVNTSGYSASSIVVGLGGPVTITSTVGDGTDGIAITNVLFTESKLWKAHLAIELWYAHYGNQVDEASAMVLAAKTTRHTCPKPSITDSGSHNFFGSTTININRRVTVVNDEVRYDHFRRLCNGTLMNNDRFDVIHGRISDSSGLARIQKSSGLYLAVSPPKKMINRNKSSLVRQLSIMAELFFLEFDAYCESRSVLESIVHKPVTRHETKHEIQFVAYKNTADDIKKWSEDAMGAKNYTLYRLDGTSNINANWQTDLPVVFKHLPGITINKWIDRQVTPYATGLTWQTLEIEKNEGDHAVFTFFNKSVMYDYITENRLLTSVGHENENVTSWVYCNKCGDTKHYPRVTMMMPHDYLSHQLTILGSKTTIPATSPGYFAAQVALPMMISVALMDDQGYDLGIKLLGKGPQVGDGSIALTQVPYLMRETSVNNKNYTNWFTKNLPQHRQGLSILENLL